MWNYLVSIVTAIIAGVVSVYISKKQVKQLKEQLKSEENRWEKEYKLKRRDELLFKLHESYIEAQPWIKSFKLWFNIQTVKFFKWEEMKQEDWNIFSKSVSDFRKYLKLSKFIFKQSTERMLIEHFCSLLDEISSLAFFMFTTQMICKSEMRDQLFAELQGKPIDEAAFLIKVGEFEQLSKEFDKILEPKINI